jgi:uncharacterized membrane protein YqaE (UPF0057 family)
MKNIHIKIFFALLFSITFIFKSYAISFPKNLNHNVIGLPLRDSSKLTDSAYIKAVQEFKNLSKAEKKMRAKAAKKMLAEYKQKKNAGDEVSTNELLLAILCVILPPLAVYLHQGKVTNNKFWISLLLTILFWVPGIIYAILVVFFDF